MTDSKKQWQELSSLIEETGEKLADDYYFSMFDFFNELGACDNGGDIPLELWRALAQAFADISGYHVSLHATVFRPAQGEQTDYSILGRREVVNVEPMLFLRAAEA